MTGAAPGEISPFAPHFFTRDRWRLHYVDEGRGDPVVMLHGNPSWSFYYRRLVEALRPRHRVIVPDHLGCGLSEKPGITEYPYTLESRVDDLEALLDQLAVDGGLTLVLHDWGGMIGMAYASRHPERIRRLIVLNTAAFHLPPDKPLPWQLRLCRSPLGPLLVRGLNAFCLGAVLLGTTRRPLPAPVRRAYLAPYNSWKNRAAIQRFVEDIPLRPGDPGYDLVTAVQEGLERFRKLPVLICWGERDFVFDGHFLDEWKRRFPAAEVHTFSDCGHYVLEDAPAEIIALVRRFIGDRSAAAGPPVNIASHLPEMASRQPETLAVAFPAGRDGEGNVSYREYSFRRLEEESNRIGRGLARIGIGRGTRTALMVPPSLEFFALTFALFKAGAVPVLIDPGIGVRNLKQCLTEAEPEAFIGVRKAHLARILLGWGRSTIRTCVTVGGRGPWGGPTLDEIRDTDPSPLLTPTGAGETAAILFTSGSTGPPKGAVYTHATFAAQVDLLRRTYGIEPGEIDLPTFPLFALFAPALGMSAVIPDMDATRPGSVDPVNIVAPIERFGVTQMFGSPALIDRVGRYLEEKDIHLPTLRRVISAGAPVPARVLERFARHLPAGGEIFTAYGATESLPVSSIGSSVILAETRAATDAGAGVCVGRPVEGMRAEIIAISDEPIPLWSEDLLLPSGEIGEITVSGPVVTRSYYNRPRATDLAKIEKSGGDFCHRMGDLGYFDGAGRLWFCGRKGQRVVTAEDTLFTIPCEAVFNTHPRVFRTALVGVPPGKEGGVPEPVLCVELEKGVPRSLRTTIRSELAALGAAHAHTRGIKTILFHNRFPVDIRHNAKIFREKLAAWAAGKLR